MAVMRGASVTLVSGPVNIEPFIGIDVVNVKSAADMAEAVAARSEESDIVVMCSAVADYTPTHYSAQKVKKSDGELSIPLARTTDILHTLGMKKKEGQMLVGFSMETENLIENSRKKLSKKNADIICANTIADGGATGFAVDTNQVTLITETEVITLPLCTKEVTADLILSHIVELQKEK